MNVAAIIVTRGDQDITRVLASLPGDWEKLVWDNGKGTLYGDELLNQDVPDLSVYGRYAAIEYTDAELIYVQDDDCVVSDPQAIVNAWIESAPGFGEWITDDGQIVGFTGVPTPEYRAVVCNMPQEFRHDFYEEHALVGFGACFHRDAPQRAFDRLGLTALPGSVVPDIDFFYRTCDIAFTALTPRVLVDIPHENLPWAFYQDRMYRQGEHLAERVRMLDLVREIR